MKWMLANVRTIGTSYIKSSLPPINGLGLYNNVSCVNNNMYGMNRGSTHFILTTHLSFVLHDDQFSPNKKLKSIHSSVSFSDRFFIQNNHLYSYYI